MTHGSCHAVTGAFGFSGKYIARRLLDAGHPVRTLTNSPRRKSPFGDSVEVHPLAFDQPDGLRESLSGVSVLYNTYWVRFNHKKFTHADGVRNTKALFQAARDAGVERIVHVSITNPSEDSPFEYFRDKARLERALEECGVSYAILRPAVLFGREDVLINNIAWLLRRSPVFGLFGRGRYRIQPIHVDDLAGLAVAQGSGRENTVIDAIGPETFTFRELVRVIARALGKRRLIVPLPPSVGYFAALSLGRIMGDMVVTRDEIRALMADLLWVDSPPAGTTKLTDWAAEHSDWLGRRYANELVRRSDRLAAYAPE